MSNINLRACHGMYFTAEIEGEPCSGKISCQPSGIYLCQNTMDGDTAIDKLGYKYSWNIGDPCSIDLVNGKCGVRNFVMVDKPPENKEETITYLIKKYKLKRADPELYERAFNDGYEYLKNYKYEGLTGTP